MKRRSFLAILGLVPVIGATAAASAETQSTKAIVDATSPDSALAMRIANLGTTRVGIDAEQFAFVVDDDARPYLFDAEGRCLNP